MGDAPITTGQSTAVDIGGSMFDPSQGIHAIGGGRGFSFGVTHTVFTIDFTAGTPEHTAGKTGLLHN
jgi:hypothetical protein